MKKTLLTMSLLAVAAVSSIAQGTINPLNGPLAATKMWVDTDGDGVKSAGDRLAAATDGLTFSIFFGTGDELSLAPGGNMTISTTSPGVLTGLPTLFQVVGGAENTTVNMKIVASNSQGWRGDTGVKQITLGPSGGPATVIWSSTAANNKFLPMLVSVPEPSTIALGVLGLGSLLLFRRRK